MTRFVELIGFAGIAVAAHVAAFSQFGPTGAQSEGAQGQANISLMASSAEMAQRVAAWTRPVETMADMTVTMTPAAPEMPALPVANAQPQAATAFAALPQLAPAPDRALPRIDTRPAAPAHLRHAPEASPRPQPRVAPRRADPAPAAKPQTQAKPPQRSAQAVQPQKARGGQSGADAGNTQKRQSATLSDAARQSLIANWGASIRNRVERRKRYPAGTNASGTTILRITITRAGRLSGVAVVKSSGTQKLDQAAITAVQKARYAAAPAGLDAAQYRFNLPVAFKRN